MTTLISDLRGSSRSGNYAIENKTPVRPYHFVDVVCADMLEEDELASPELAPDHAPHSPIVTTFISELVECKFQIVMNKGGVVASHGSKRIHATRARQSYTSDVSAVLLETDDDA
jgi:hypothetical protein